MNIVQEVRTAGLARPRIGFLGVGWIGRNRMEAALATGAVEAVGVADMDPLMAAAAGELAPAAVRVSSPPELLQLDLDGVVIATPSALHAEQCLHALEAGVAVFCQKPLGRSAAEVQSILNLARRRNLLLDVDFSYRHTEGMRRIHKLVASGKLGHLYAVDLVFHNAYGPDKAWFYDPAQSGGGCVMDLGIHLVDLALWTLNYPAVKRVLPHLYGGGVPLDGLGSQVEDYAVATLELSHGAVVRLACSWRLHAGRDAVISAEFHGTDGGAVFRNVNGSFYDFEAEHHTGTSRRFLAEPPDAWGGRAVARWARQLAQGAGYAPQADRLLDVAQVIDRIYGNG